MIRPIVVALALYNAFAAAFVAVDTLFMIRDLGLGPGVGWRGHGGSGVGGVVGGDFAERAAIRFGMGRAIMGSTILLSIGHVAAPLALGGSCVTVPLLCGAGVLASIGLVISTVSQTSLIRQLVPAHALGRVSAAQQVVVMATVRFGAVVGGMLGESLGLRFTVGLGAVGTIIATLSLLLSPLMTALGPASECYRYGRKGNG